ncbi:MAG: hypothetical protein N2117_12425 [Anaerolineales bacterium]|nr:hypothetical protein [Anaerolineales bacterium]MCX7756029.1 hypothetical protein [Anaerolineales bacterium]MDW8277037.1 hypothetical protein [Anaerolineales bacterium]
MLQVIHYLPIVTTIIAFSFTGVLLRHWMRKRSATYLLWWGIGTLMFGIGTSTEAIHALFGWNEANLKAWYISGALFGAFPLAQGTVYLLFKKKTADVMAGMITIYCLIASILIAASPINSSMVTGELTGKVLGWSWVRAFSPLPNMYGLIFLVGGAAWSAIQYARKQGSGNRALGNWLIALGGLLPGIGGTFTRLGFVEILFITEFFGISLIWAGYRVILSASQPSIHPIQQQTQI